MRYEVPRLLACLLGAFPVAIAASAAEGDVQPAEGLKLKDAWVTILKVTTKRTS
jgi:hypothetical protein